MNTKYYEKQLEKIFGPDIARQAVRYSNLFVNIPKIVGFCGAAGAGKDTSAFLLGLLGYQRTAMADALKVEAYNVLSHSAVPRQIHDQIKEIGAYQLDWYETDEEKIAEINRLKPTLRRFLQWYGTEYRRAQDPDYWVKRVISKISDGGLWTVSDIRFPNEIDMIRQNGGVVWMIAGRSDGITPTHASETEWKNSKFDCVFDNSTSVLNLQCELYAQVYMKAPRVII